MKSVMLSLLVATWFFVIAPIVFSFTSWWVSLVFGYEVGFWPAVFMVGVTMTIAALTYELFEVKKADSK